MAKAQAKRKRGRPPKYNFGLLRGNVRRLVFGPFATRRDIANCQNAAWQYADRHGLVFDTKRHPLESGGIDVIVIRKHKRGA